MTPDELRAALADSPDIRVFYLTVSSNPTAFAYTPDELRALCAVLRECAAEVLILATSPTSAPAIQRMIARAWPPSPILMYAAKRLVLSFSKTHTLTGDRCGWVVFGDPATGDRALALAGAMASPRCRPSGSCATWPMCKLFAEHPRSRSGSAHSIACAASDSSASFSG